MSGSSSARYSLTELLERVEADKANHVLSETLIHPRTEDMVRETCGHAELRIEQVGTLNLEAIREEVAKSPNLIAVRALPDVNAALGWLIRDCENYGLQLFDGLVLTRHGVALLYVTVTGKPQVGRITALDLDLARRRLRDKVEKQGPSGTSGLLTATSAVLGVAGVLVLGRLMGGMVST